MASAVKKAVSIDGELAGLIGSYAAAGDLTFSEAIRKLCRIGLSNRPESAFLDPAGEMTAREVVDAVSEEIASLRVEVEALQDYIAALPQNGEEAF